VRHERHAASILERWPSLFRREIRHLARPGNRLERHVAFRDACAEISKLAEPDRFDDRQIKPANIDRHIGRHPILAFGNSDGDLAMMLLHHGLGPLTETLGKGQGIPADDRKHEKRLEDRFQRRGRIKMRGLSTERAGIGR